MIRVIIILGVVVYVFLNSPLRQPEPAVEAVKAAAAGGRELLEAAAKEGPERVLLVEGARRAAQSGLEGARRALSPPVPPRHPAEAQRHPLVSP